MDFLDPRKKRSRRIRLTISYLLMAILVAAGAFVLIYSSRGYGINTKTGEIVQNGLVFVDSAPASGNIYLNGIAQNKKTSARLLLPQGKYQIKVVQNGYRTWSDSFRLEPESLLRLDYALTIPTRLQPQDLASLHAGFQFLTQSPDHHWLVALSGTSQPEATEFDVANPTAASVTLPIPSGIVKLSGGAWRPVSWSADSNFLLLRHDSGSRQEYVVLDRTDPASSYNLSLLIGSAQSVDFRAGSSNQFLVLMSGGGLSLYSQPTRKSTAVAKSVADFQSLSSSRLAYSTLPVSGVAAIKIWNGSQSYTLAQLHIKSGAKVLLAVSGYQGQEYYAVTQSGQDEVTIYQNPLSSLSTVLSTLKPLATLKLAHPQYLSFSPDGRLLVAQNGQNFGAYNLELAQSSYFKLKYPLAGALTWADSNHLAGLAKSGFALISDYDGANQQTLTKSSLPSALYLSPDDKWLFSETNSHGIPELQLSSLLISSL